jgi:hypothetical protein
VDDYVQIHTLENKKVERLVLVREILNAKECQIIGNGNFH